MRPRTYGVAMGNRWSPISPQARVAPEATPGHRKRGSMRTLARCQPALDHPGCSDRAPAVAPMRACNALPQPLRWFMGRWARQLNATLAVELVDQRRRTLHWHPEITTISGIAVDGLHPDSGGYSVWADGLSQHILATQARSIASFELGTAA